MLFINYIPCDKSDNPCYWLTMTSCALLFDISQEWNIVELFFTETSATQTALQPLRTLLGCNLGHCLTTIRNSAWRQFRILLCGNSEFCCSVIQNSARQPFELFSAVIPKSGRRQFWAELGSDSAMALLQTHEVVYSATLINSLHH